MVSVNILAKQNLAARTWKPKLGPQLAPGHRPVGAAALPVVQILHPRLAVRLAVRALLLPGPPVVRTLGAHLPPVRAQALLVRNHVLHARFRVLPALDRFFHGPPVAAALGTALRGAQLAREVHAVLRVQAAALTRTRSGL
jgi:hypothetical protein